jgi:hypothetical protein
MSALELEQHINESVTTLLQLCDIYDSGRPYIAFNMATEIASILTENAVAARIRAAKTYTISARGADKNNLNAHNSLVFMRIDTSPPKADFIPVFQWDYQGTKSVNFAEWWNRDIVWVAGSAKEGVPLGLIPLDPAEQVPWEKRARLVRRELITMMRNKLGAHLDTVLPEILDQMQRAEIMGMGASVVTDNGELFTWDGTLPIGIGPGAAMVRQISHELLTAYGATRT